MDLRVNPSIAVLAVFILETRYLSVRASVNILQFEIRRSRRISKSSSSRRVTRLVPVFILETDNRTKYKMFAEARTDG